MAQGLFNLAPRSTKASDSKLLKRAQVRNAQANSIKLGSSGNSLLDQINIIKATVLKVFGDELDNYEIITETSRLESYIDKAIDNGILAYDTETNSLDTLTCTLAGVCLFTPGERGAYVPINHVSHVTGVRVDSQLTNSQVSSVLARIDASTKLVMHNAKFDLKVTQNTLGLDFSKSLYWDTFIGAYLLNENEPRGLKALHAKYVVKDESAANSYESLFKGIPFTHIPIKTGYLYAAKDPEMTFELYEFQKQFLDEASPKCEERGLINVAKLFRQIEMPLVPVVAQMETNGIRIDLDYANKLTVSYREKLTEAEKCFQDTCDMYADEIQKYRIQNRNSKLGNPINVASPDQLAILLYDILKIESPDSKKPRGTGEEILEKMDTPLAKAILNYRGIAKLLSTYIEKLPRVVNSKTGKIHASFNQTGADTGRFSSSDPNLQNIPSGDKAIRKMFRPSKGCYLISADLSQQEPRILAEFSQDENLLQAYRDGKDIYAFIGSMCYSVPYEQCLEFNSDGSRNPDGKKRRNSAKSIVLGIMYGRGAHSIADQLGVSVKEAEKIILKFNAAFPQVKDFVDRTLQFASNNGFVETIWGRKRRIPDMLLDEYEFKYEEGREAGFNPMDFSNLEDEDCEVDEQTIREYVSALKNCWGWKKKQAILGQAKDEGIIIKDNGGKIADAIRQCVNSRIQGTAADMVKLGMVRLSQSEKLKELGCRLLIQVHDEVIAEAPIENAFEVSRIMAQIMIDAAAEKVKVPMKVDLEILDMWYGEPIEEAA